MAEILPPPETFDLSVETLIVGAGAAGMVAALAAHEAGQSVLVIEADAVPAGSTALSAGLIPAAGTQVQRAAGVADDVDQFAADIQAKAKGENDSALVRALCETVVEAIDWLGARHGLNFSLVTDFDYPGHTHRRMHGLPTRAGRELVDALRSACEAASIDIVCKRRADALFSSAHRIAGVRAHRPDGGHDTIGCARLILACNGFGGNRDMVAQEMPGIQDGLWFGHDGNRGEAVMWGRALGAGLHQMGAFQGHGNVAHPHGILITWATIMEGGIQVNRAGDRFWDESQGYSEAARAVLAQPGGVAWAIFDARIADIARQFEDFRRAEAGGAVKTAPTLRGLARSLGIDAPALERAVESLTPDARDAFGRLSHRPRLHAPYCGVRVTGALFHTQGGLITDGTGRVQSADGTSFGNLFACGGAACGVSGSADTGYLSGNGLLSAVALGYAAGRA